MIQCTSSGLFEQRYIYGDVIRYESVGAKQCRNELKPMVPATRRRPGMSFRGSWTPADAGTRTRPARDGSRTLLVQRWTLPAFECKVHTEVKLKDEIDPKSKAKNDLKREINIDVKCKVRINIQS